jgi:hypothetical protein
MDNDWPFDQDKNVAALTTRQVLEDKLPILRVVHYSDDHSWAFTCGTTDDTDDGRIVCMSHILEIDPTIVSIAHLEPGCVADRAGIGEPWETWHDPEM